MAATWLRYKNNDNATVIFNLDRATHFRHISGGQDTFVEVFVDGTVHAIMRITDPDAYRVTVNYIAMTTGFTLEE